MPNPLITIAIPVYNNERTIIETLDSCILQETNISYEILILDDASTDSTPSILKKYKSDKISIVTLKERVPLIENHNKCLEHAKGDYILFCHADDTLEPNALSILEEQLKKRKYPKKYVVWGHSMFRDYSIQLKKSGFHYNELIVGEYAALLPMHGGLTPSGTCYSRETFINAGGFINVNIMLAPSDIVTMLHLALEGFHFEMIDQMYFIRKDASTMTSSTSSKDFLEAYDDAYLCFMHLTSKASIKKLLYISRSLNDAPYYFYYSIAQNDNYNKEIKSILIKQLIKNPFLIFKKIFIKTFLRVMK